MSDTKIILDLLQELKNDQKEHGKITQSQAGELVRLTVCLENLELDTGDIKKDISEIKTDVAYHIHRTDILEQLHLDNQKRIEKLEKEAHDEQARLQKLEEPGKAKAWLRENYLTTTGIVIAGLTVASMLLRLFGLI